MPPKHFHLFWLILPSAVFFLLLAAFVVKLARKPLNKTEARPTPTPISFPSVSPPPPQGISSLVIQIQGWQLTDPLLAAPIVDRKISLPAE